MVHIERARPPRRRHLGVVHFLVAQPGGAAEAQDQLVVIMRLVTRLGDRLQSFFLGDVLGDHFAHFFEMIAARVEQSEARQGS